MVGYLFPALAVDRTPNIVQSLVLRHIVSATEYPHFSAVHDCLMVRTWRPWRRFRFQHPLLPIGRRPNIVLKTLFISEVVVFCPAEQPQLPLEFHKASSNPRTPASIRGDLFPPDSIC